MSYTSCEDDLSQWHQEILRFWNLYGIKRETQLNRNETMLRKTKTSLLFS